MSSPPAETLQTPLTKLLNIRYPVLLAGMGNVAGPELAAAVSKAGGLGVMGGAAFSPEGLRKAIRKLKEEYGSEDAPYGIDLLLPQVGGSARKTNYDLTKGQLPELVDIMIQEKCKLFVSAVGVPPKWAVDRLHAAGIAVMNMVGAPKHALKAIAVGADIICAQGHEAGGHTGEITTAILIPKVVDVVKGYKSPLTGGPIHVVAAGGIYDGRGLAMSLCFGAEAVWVGTRFVAAKEANASPRHKNLIINAGYTSTVRTIIFTGRPNRVLKNPYIMDWEENRQKEIKDMTSRGVIPVTWELEQMQKSGTLTTDTVISATRLLAGQVAGSIHDVKSAADIVNEIVSGAVDTLRRVRTLVAPTPKL